MKKRESIGKRLRFEVFKRDKFTCQYCGRSAPDIILQVDHIIPVNAGGDKNILNLITSCIDCNAGKGKRKLTDTETIQKQKGQLDELQERREQLAAMVRWQKELQDIYKDAICFLQDLWLSLVPGYAVNEVGCLSLRRLLSKYSLQEVAEAMSKSTAQYLKMEDGKLTQESIQKAFHYIGRILNFTRRNQNRPYMADLCYIRGILRNRLPYINWWQVLDLLEQAYKAGNNVDDLRAIALNCRNWTEWRATMNSLIGEDDAKTPDA